MSSSSQFSFVSPELLQRLSQEWRTPLQGILGVIPLLQKDKRSPEEEEALAILAASSDELRLALEYFTLVFALEKGTIELRPPAQILITSLAAQLTEGFEEYFQNLAVKSLPLTDTEASVLLSPDLLKKLRITIAYIFPSASEATLSLYYPSTENAQFRWQLEVLIPDHLNPSIDGQMLQQLTQKLAIDYFSQGKLFTFGQGLLLHSAQPEHEDAIRAAPNKVLVVDDNPTNRRVVSQILQDMGVSVRATDDPEEVHTLLRDQTFGLVLMDIEMPQQDGRDLTRALRQKLGDTLPPIVAFTALVTEERQTWLSSGLMDDFLAKPATPNEFQQLLSRWGLSENTKKQAEQAQESPTLPDFLDAEVLAQLHKYGGQALIRESFAEFVDETKKLFKQAFLALQTQNFEQVRKILHTLKGSAATLGIVELAEKAKAMEAQLTGTPTHKEVYHDFRDLHLAYQKFELWERTS